VIVLPEIPITHAETGVQFEPEIFAGLVSDFDMIGRDEPKSAEIGSTKAGDEPTTTAPTRKYRKKKDEF